MPIQNTYKIEKSNLLNEIKDNKMSLQELRFFCIYLSKINARDVSTRCVRFPLSDFQKIMNIGRMNIKHFKTAVNGLLCKVVHMPTDDGGLSSFQLFKEVKLFKDDSEKWFVEIDAHDNAIPLFFNLKGRYFTYELWNALRLKSVNQLRMYELLKQRETLGTFEIKMSELREFLFIAPEQYTQLVRFKARVLDSCQKALAENTDICYTYECGKRGARGKWLTIVFHISKNTSYKSPMELDEFIDKQPQPKPECVPDELPEAPELCSDFMPDASSQAPESHLDYSTASSSPFKRQPHLSGEFEKDLKQFEINVLCDMLACKVPKASERTPELLKKRLKVLYGDMLISSKEPIRSVCAYLKSCIVNLEPDRLPPISAEEDNFDIDKYKLFINDF